MQSTDVDVSIPCRKYNRVTRPVDLAIFVINFHHLRFIEVVDEGGTCGGITQLHFTAIENSIFS